MFTTSNMQLLYFIEIHVSKADASLSSGLWRPPTIPSLHVYSNVRASINFLINARRPSSYHFHTPTISQYFPLSSNIQYHPHIILVLISFSKLCSYHFHTPTISQYFPFSISSSYHSHIILKIMLISFPQPAISQYYPHHQHALKCSMSHIFRV